MYNVQIRSMSAQHTDPTISLPEPDLNPESAYSSVPVHSVPISQARNQGQKYRPGLPAAWYSDLEIQVVFRELVFLVRCAGIILVLEHSWGSP